MTRKEIASRVTHALADLLVIKEDCIKENSCFLENLGMDSLDEIEMVMALEDLFNIEIDERAYNCETVKDIIEVIELLEARK